jgi:hypothetical protein
MAFSGITSSWNPKSTCVKREQTPGPLATRNIDVEHPKSDDTDTAKARTNVIDAWKLDRQVGKCAEGERVAFGSERG